jgi:hypothetical protein
VLPPLPSNAAFPLDELMANLAKPPERHAHFVEEKSFAALNGTLRSSGTLAYRRPAHLEKTTLEPVPESLVVDGNRLVIAGNDAPHVVELDAQPEIRALVDTIRGALSGDIATLRRFYSIDPSGTLQDWHLVLHPTDPAVTRLVREVRIAGGADVRSIESVQPNGDTDHLTITPDS